MKTIAKKMSKVMSDVAYIQKQGKNAHFNYKFVKEADIVDRVSESLIANGVALSTQYSDYARSGDLTSVKATLTFICVDTGETLVAVAFGEGQDKSDKGAPKAQTSALKYALLKTLLIATGDDPEDDSRLAPPPLPKKVVTNGPR